MARTTGMFFSIGACTGIAIAAALIAPTSSRAQSAVPTFEVDDSPKPLPDRWVLGGLGGVCVDARDHVFILNRQDLNEGDLHAGTLAPPIIEFDPAGSVVHSWGDYPARPARLHSCHVDKDNNVWIASAPSGMVQKYSHDGSKLLLQIGKKGVLDSSDGTVKGKPLNSNAAQFFMPSSIFVDRQNGDVYVSDGEGAGGNRRVAVMDRTGNFLRQWQPEGMETVHCMTIANDGLVYVCNRQESRIQVYDKMGRPSRKNIERALDARHAASDGRPKQSGGGGRGARLLARCESAAHLRHQPEQLADRDHRPEAGRNLSDFGGAGHFPGIQPGARHRGRFKGNVFIAENRGKRRS